MEIGWISQLYIYRWRPCMCYSSSSFLLLPSSFFPSTVLQLLLICCFSVFLPVEPLYHRPNVPLLSHLSGSSVPFPSFLNFSLDVAVVTPSISQGNLLQFFMKIDPMVPFLLCSFYPFFSSSSSTSSSSTSSSS